MAVALLLRSSVVSKIVVKGFVIVKFPYATFVVIWATQYFSALNSEKRLRCAIYRSGI